MTASDAIQPDVAYWFDRLPLAAQRELVQAVLSTSKHGKNPYDSLSSAARSSVHDIRGCVPRLMVFEDAQWLGLAAFEQRLEATRAAALTAPPDSTRRAELRSQRARVAYLFSAEPDLLPVPGGQATSDPIPE